jgi:hypothetical protein
MSTTTVQLLVAGKRPSKLVAKKAADRPPFSGRAKPPGACRRRDDNDRWWPSLSGSTAFATFGEINSQNDGSR